MVEANPFVAAGARGRRPACRLPRRSARSNRPPRVSIRKRFLPDEFVVAGADVYLKLPNGVAKSNLTNARLDKAFGTVATMRNWRTVLRLLEQLER